MHQSIRVFLLLASVLGSSAMAAPLELTNCRVDSVTATTVNFGRIKVSQCTEMFGRDEWSLEVTRKNENGVMGVRELAMEALTHGLRVDVEGDRKSKDATVDTLTIRANPLLQ